MKSETGKDYMEVIENIFDEEKIKEYRPIPFWSWNDELEENELREQIRWMKKQGFSGYFMHARGGLKTEYLGEKWFDCINACLDEGEKQGLDSWAYDENGWPSGFVGGKLLEDVNNRDRYLTYSTGEYDENSFVSYDISGDKLKRTKEKKDGVTYLNVYNHISASTADVLNPEVVDKFLAETHQKYKEKTGANFGRLLKGFFTDEPQYYRSAQPYTRVIEKYFKEKYGEDVLDGLGLLFTEKEGYKTFRYRFWKSLQELFVNNFSKRVYEWCKKNDVQLTGHYVEERDLKWQLLCCGGIMPNYMYESIPGMDHLGREISSPIAPRQVSSVAMQLGKKKVLTETFACCGWDVTPKELKRIAEWQYVNGVNLMCQHLLPYSEYGQRKRDYPAHFSWANPWVRQNFKRFNDYFAKLGYLLGESKEIVNVAYFSPLRSIYFDYKRDDFDAPLKVDESYLKTAEKLSAMNLHYHIIDETVLAECGSTADGKLIVGNCTYDYIVFPETLTMDKTTAGILEKFYSDGGKMLFTEGMPKYLEGEKHTYSFKTNVSLEEIVESQEIKIDSFDTEIQSTLREFGGRKFIFAVNLGKEKSYKIRFSGCNGFERLNVETGEVSDVSSEMEFAPCESAVLFLSDKNVNDIERKKEEIVLNAPYEIVEATDNYLLLDKVRYSLDGKNFEKPLLYMGVFNELLKKRYNGDVYLKFEFTVKEKPSSVSFLSEDMNNVWCKVNGEKVCFNGVSDFDKKIYKSEISDKVKLGKNEIELKINFYESDHVYYVLFGENVTESLKNCLAYDTTIEPCYLQGDFGVYSDGGFVRGKTENVYIADDFYIGKRKTTVSDIVKDGYPFFAGSMKLKTEFNASGNPAELKMNGRYAIAYLTVNGKRVEKSYFSESADVSSFVKKGKNVAEAELISGNRNLLGPHHYLPEEEPLHVGPGNFELPDSWKDGESSLERKNYSFVRFGLFND